MASTYIDEALTTYFLTDSTLTGYIGDRLYHSRAPERAPIPYGVLTLVAPDNTAVILGTQKAGHHLFQFMVASELTRTGSIAFLAGQRVITLIRDYSGSMDGITVRNVTNLRGPMVLPDPQFQNRVNAVVTFEIEYLEAA